MSMKFFYSFAALASPANTDLEKGLVAASGKIAELEAEVRGLRNKPLVTTENQAAHISAYRASFPTEFEADKPYFVHDHEGDCFVFFATEEERDEHAEGIIQDHLDDCWDESVVNILAGVMTHKIKQVNLEPRPDDVDEEGTAGDGSYWAEDWQFKCDYKLVKAELC